MWTLGSGPDFHPKWEENILLKNEDKNYQINYNRKKLNYIRSESSAGRWMRSPIPMASLEKVTLGEWLNSGPSLQCDLVEASLPGPY